MLARLLRRSKPTRTVHLLSMHPDEEPGEAVRFERPRVRLVRLDAPRRIEHRSHR